MMQDEMIDLEKNNYVILGTIESYNSIKKYYSKDKVVPIMLDVDDEIRIQRALDRELKQVKPKINEMCRRFLADSKDYSVEIMQQAEITRTFKNIDLQECIENIIEFIKKDKKQ